MDWTQALMIDELAGWDSSPSRRREPSSSQYYATMALGQAVAKHHFWGRRWQNTILGYFNTCTEPYIFHYFVL
jgi:hypothetical protein